MSWTRLQTVASTPGSAGTTVATYTSNVSSGSKLIAYVSNDTSGTGSITSVKDGAGNTMTQLALIDYPGTQGSLGVYAMDTPAGDVGTKPTITATFGTTFGNVELLEEVSGLAVGNTLAAMVDGTPVTGSGTTSPATCSGYTSSVAGEYLVGIVGDAGYATSYTLTGYTANAVNPGPNGDAQLNQGFKNSAGGSESLSWAISGATNWASILFAFQLAGGGGAATATPSPIVAPSMAAHQAASW